MSADPNSDLTRHLRGDPEKPEALEPGSKIGRFTIEDRLGAGGMGVVYTAYDPKLGRRVAVKVLHGSTSGAGQERLLREAQAMARLAHPNVVVIYDVGVVGEAVFLAMELVEGTTLAAWLKETPRPWREVVRVFLQAGRGLAAAHAAGIVHRDFKPANVLVGRDGRARVTDFGLARDAGDETLSDPPAKISAEMEAVAETLTRQGAVLGTPAYMAPEQRRGERSTRRADQYSFCVALSEGITGARPASGLPTRRPVPHALRKVLARGLSSDQKARYPSMDDLLADLERGLHRTRRLLGVAGGLAVVLATAGIVGGARLAPAPRCDARARLGGVWDGPRKAAMHAAFLATHLPYAERQWQGVERTIDAYSAKWAARSDALCEAHGRVAPAVAGGRAACLDQLLANLRSWGGVFDDADTALVKNAVESAGNLDDLAECDEPDDVPTPRPDDPALAAQVVGLRAELSAAHAQSRAGDYQPALAKIRRLLDTARTLGYRPFVAEAMVGLADALSKASEWKDAFAAYFDARDLAEELRYDRVRVRVGLGLVFAYASTFKYEEAHLTARLAGAMARPLTGPFARLERARLTIMEANAYWGDGRLAHALELFERGLAEAEPIWGSNDANTAGVYSDEGSVLLELGRYDEAEARLRRALDIFLALNGDSHPSLGSIANNLGSLRYHRRDYQGAVGWYREALAVKDRAGLPADNLSRGYTTLNLGESLYQLSQLDEARELVARARVILAGKLGPRHELMAEVETYEGLIALAGGSSESAVASLEDALVIRRESKVIGADRADTELALARALQAAGRDKQRARSLGESARADYVAAGKKDEAVAAADWLKKL